MAETVEAPIIVLPEDPTRVEQLRLKLAEYQDRMRSYDESQENQHPELRIGRNWNLFCRIRGLELLFETGRIDTHEFSFRLAKRYPVIFDADGFEMAMSIINDYATTGGENCQGGTGLPEIP